MHLRHTSMAASGALVAALLVGGSGVPAAAAPVEAPGSAAASPNPLRPVTFVGNNWAGTATVVDTHTRQVLKVGVDLVPDKAQELDDIYRSPDRLAFYLAIQQGPGEGHDQYVDDMFSTPDGRYLAVSRPSFGDVVWVDIAKATAGEPDPIVREQQMDGYRTDHMGLSPDGERLLVSDSTEAQVIEYAMTDQVVDGAAVKMGDRLRSFPSGETPHENHYSPNGKLIYHASIGKVYLPGDQTSLGPIDVGPVHDAVKGDRWYQIVRNADFSILNRWDMGKELAEAGFEGMSSAVRPMAVAPGGRTIYFQVSYFHGIVEFDTRAADIDGAVSYTAGDIPEPRTGAVTRLIQLPNHVPDMPREEYVNDSAHHGLSIDEEGETLCVAGTMDDYAALVDTKTGDFKLYDEKTMGHSYGKPYWTTEGPHGTCWISLSEADAVAVLDSETGAELAYLPVGDHPQRVRHGVVESAVAGSWTDPGVPAAPSSGVSVLTPINQLLGQLLLAVDRVLDGLPALPTMPAADTPLPKVTSVEEARAAVASSAR